MFYTDCEWINLKKQQFWYVVSVRSSASYRPIGRLLQNVVEEKDKIEQWTRHFCLECANYVNWLHETRLIMQLRNYSFRIGVISEEHLSSWRIRNKSELLDNFILRGARRTFSGRGKHQKHYFLWVSLKMIKKVFVVLVPYVAVSPYIRNKEQTQ